MEETNFQIHSVIIDSRKKLNISGVRDVESFEDETIALKTVMGDMTIKGENLKILSFNAETADLSAEGKIHAVVYMSDAKKKQGIISRIFR